MEEGGRDGVMNARDERSPCTVAMTRARRRCCNEIPRYTHDVVLPREWLRDGRSEPDQCSFEPR